MINIIRGNGRSLGLWGEIFGVGAEPLAGTRIATPLGVVPVSADSAGHVTGKCCRGYGHF